MGARAQKAKLTSGMSVAQAKKKFLEIWASANPGQSFEEVHGKMWPWLETWFRLRARNESLDLILQACAEAIAKRNKEKHRLQEAIHTQRVELVKRLRELEDLKNAANGTEPSGAGTRTTVVLGNRGTE